MKYVPGFEPFNFIRSPISIHPISPSVSRRFYCCWFYGRLVRCLEVSFVYRIALKLNESLMYAEGDKIVTSFQARAI